MLSLKIMVSLTDLDHSLLIVVIALLRMLVLSSFNVFLWAPCRDRVLDACHLDRSYNILPRITV